MSQIQQDVLYVYWCLWWPSMQLAGCQCTICALMYQSIYMDDQDDPWCSWMSWIPINTQVVSWCTKVFIWMLIMTLTAAECLGCLLMHELDETRHFYINDQDPQCIWISNMSLMYKLYLMHKDIYMDDQDDTWYSWMSWISINAQVNIHTFLLWCWKLKRSSSTLKQP